MLGKLHRLISNFKNLNTNKVCFIVFRDKTVQKIVIDLNRIDQLFYEGVKSDGSSLPLYSQATGAIAYNKIYTFEGKSTTKAKGQPYTLFDEGDYYRSFRLIQDPTGFTITANDEKENSTLQEMYGGNIKILGLTDESISKLTNEIKPYLVEAIRSELLRFN